MAILDSIRDLKSTIFIAKMFTVENKRFKNNKWANVPHSFVRNHSIRGILTILFMLCYIAKKLFVVTLLHTNLGNA